MKSCSCWQAATCQGDYAQFRDWNYATRTDTVPYTACVDMQCSHSGACQKAPQPSWLTKQLQQRNPCLIYWVNRVPGNTWVSPQAIKGKHPWKRTARGL
eukprot:1143519-Pelagomonas_calceolata.AAC.1